VLYACLIAVFASLVLRSTGLRPPLAGPGGEGGFIGYGTLLWLIPTLHAVLAAVVHLTARRTLSAIERTNSLRPTETLDAVVASARVAAAMLTAAGVCLLGYLDAVRWVVGDVILIDEGLTALPFLLLVVAGWWSTYPIEKLLRDSTFIRDLDDGRPIYPPPTRAGFVWGHVRHQLLILLLPMAMMAVLWGSVEGVVHKAHDRFRAAVLSGLEPDGVLERLGAWMHAHPTQWPLVYYAIKLCAMAVIIASAPLVIRRVWDTTPLREGSIAEGLLRMCRQQGVKVRDLLVWRTGGTMINGAVLGVLGRARYILLTDGLLDVLPNHAVQAVMAHEIGHVRCRHVPWLTATLLAASGTALFAADAALRLALGTDLDHLPETAQLAVCAAAFGGAVAAFGYVSRRFEWQADAFAAKHFSVHTPPTDDPEAPWTPSPTVTRPAVASMCAALEIVAEANNLPRSRFTFRHGSIATRVARLRALEGQPLNALRVDAVSRWLKRAVLAGCVLVVATAVYSIATAVPGR